MSIESKTDGVKRLLERVLDSKRIVDADNLETATVDDLKDNAKGLCDSAKLEIDNIKDEIDSWG